MNNALTPDFFFNSIPSMQADNEADRKGATEEEKALFALKQMKGWLVLKEYIENIYEEVGSINKTAIARGQTLEEIGRNAVVINLVQEVIERILNKVSYATEACTGNEQ